MKISIEIDQAENGLVCTSYDNGGKTTWVFTNFMDMKRWVERQLKPLVPPAEQPAPQAIAANPV